MKSSQPPRTLTFNGRMLVSAGVGNEPQAFLYFDPSQQRLQVFFIGTVKTTGEVYAVVTVEGNPRLNRVRIDLSAVIGGLRLNVGDTLLIGEVSQHGVGMSAAIALMLVPAAKPTPKPASAITPGRCTGTVIFTRGTWGKISNDADGNEIFAHIVHWRSTIPMQVGQRCSFVKAKTEKGVAAFDIRQIAA